MKVNALHFENYRNLKDNTIAPSERVNVIYGENANGKTNLLEALWLFCGGHSFRGAKENELIRFDRDFFRLKMDFESGEREQSAEILFDKNKKSIKLNGVDKNSSSYLTEVFSAVVFSPEHLSLIKRGPNVRRRFLDAAICQHRIRYASLLADYNRIINQISTNEIQSDQNLKVLPPPLPTIPTLTSLPSSTDKPSGKSFPTLRRPATSGPRSWAPGLTWL